MVERQDAPSEAEQAAELMSDVERLEPALPQKHGRHVLDRLVAGAHGERDVAAVGGVRPTSNVPGGHHHASLEEISC
jgi:hypothetical protein